MLIVSTRVFREKQGEYLSKAANGEDIVLKSRSSGCFKLVPVTEDDALMSREAFLGRIDRAKEGINKGKGKTIHTREELLEYLDSL